MATIRFKFSAYVARDDIQIPSRISLKLSRENIASNISAPLSFYLWTSQSRIDLSQ